MKRKVVRVDKSPMNPKVTVAQLECGHDEYVYRSPRIGQMLKCSRCQPKEDA